MSDYYRKWAIAIAIQTIISSLIGGGLFNFLAIIFSGLCLAPGWLGLVGAIEEAVSQNNQTKGTRLFAVLIAAPWTLFVVMMGGLAWLAGWAIPILTLLSRFS